MKATLEIYKAGKIVNTFEWTDEVIILRKFADCITSKLRGIKTRIVRLPYVDVIEIDHRWPNDEVTKDYRYHYVFNGVERGEC